MKARLALISLAVAAPASAAEMLTAHYWGEDDYVAPQPVELKLTASGESVRLSTRDGPLEELGVTLTPKRSLAIGGQDAHIAAIRHFGDGKIAEAQRGGDDDRREK